jgi:exo-beta-1,3-glucanase (GH17 family)
LIPVILLVAGCGGEPDPYLREDPFVIREFQPFSGDRWIGNAISYGPFRDGQAPGDAEITPEQLREDLQLMLPHWNLMRIYGSTEYAETLLEVIRTDGLDMKVMLGVWIAANSPEANSAEVEAAIRLTKKYGDIILAVSVGNETQVYWSAHRCPFDELLVHVRHVRARVDVPVTVADDYNYWNKEESRAIATEIDFITLHAHPLWNGLSLTDALPWVQEQIQEVQTLHPDRLVVVGETGWATAVHNEGEQARLIKGRPGESQQKTFYQDTRAWADAERFTVFYFEAFDENWKGGDHPNEVEKHWGLFRADRSPKAAIQSR